LCSLLCLSLNVVYFREKGISGKCRAYLSMLSLFAGYAQPKFQYHIRGGNE
jgi:hypothetical protein